MHELEEEAHSTPIHAYIHRVKRHINDLKSLPEIVRNLPQSFMRGFLGTIDTGIVSVNQRPEEVFKGRNLICPPSFS